MTAYTPSAVKRTIDEDLSGIPRDILEFNHRQLARSYVEWVEMIEKHHARQLAALRRSVGRGTYAGALLIDLARTGRKTVRISQILDRADVRLAQLRAQDPHLGAGCEHCGSLARDILTAAADDSQDGIDE